MSVILLALYLIGTGIYAAPTSFHIYPESANCIIVKAECVCPDAAAARSVLDIVWGCLATTFLCTWVTVHPNIPSPREDWWWVAWRRAKAMYWSVVAPESTIIWAIRQWRGARYLANKYKCFLLYEDEKPSITLMEDHFDRLLKDDALSKGLALFQTLWFVIQCIARGAQHLALTEIELSTIALAVLNAVTYFFWWNKPLDVQHPVAVFLILKKVDDTPTLKDEPNAEIPVNEWSSESTSNHIPSMILWKMWTLDKTL
ncbi:hypothetical protein BDQ12DRAFT_701673 [Crucibulum laeve]|uniref:Uncharacterized protein n=1 Tax=Crucibulum laeve TaxID=68775 RepID=A0A5C3MGH8_9AGAR|nr:hypothetical protein BDQ12DRAFT_701673 [Crucibulum laeve]